MKTMIATTTRGNLGIEITASVRHYIGEIPHELDVAYAIVRDGRSRSVASDSYTLDGTSLRPFLDRLVDNIHTFIVTSEYIPFWGQSLADRPTRQHLLDALEWRHGGPKGLTWDQLRLGLSWAILGDREEEMKKYSLAMKGVPTS